VSTAELGALFDVTVNRINKAHISRYRIGGTIKIPKAKAIGVPRKFDQSIPEWFED